MPDPENILSRFHPLIAKWFTGTIGTPTAIQQAAWPNIADGEHILATAPTGSGKTLAAFLWSLNQLITQAWEPGETRILYISPLKALNNDIHRNLLRPLKEIRALFKAEDEPIPVVKKRRAIKIYGRPVTRSMAKM